MYRVVPQASAEPRADERWPAGEGATKKIVKTVRFDAPTLQAALDGRSRWPMS